MHSDSGSRNAANAPLTRSRQMPILLSHVLFDSSRMGVGHSAKSSSERLYTDSASNVLLMRRHLFIMRIPFSSFNGPGTLFEETSDEEFVIFIASSSSVSTVPGTSDKHLTGSSDDMIVGSSDDMIVKWAQVTSSWTADGRAWANIVSGHIMSIMFNGCGAEVKMKMVPAPCHHSWHSWIGQKSHHPLFTTKMCFLCSFATKNGWTGDAVEWSSKIVWLCVLFTCHTGSPHFGKAFAPRLAAHSALALWKGGMFQASTFIWFGHRRTRNHMTWARNHVDQS